MIFTERTITVVNDSATINKPLILYRGDKNIELKITIAESQFKFRNNDASNVIETTDASYAQLVINTPYNSPIFSEVAATKNGTVIFVISEAMIDEIREVGIYDIQIRLLDDDKQSRVTIPPVSNAIEIREPMAIEDGSAVDSNVVNVAKVNRALTTTSAPLEAFDSQGNYIKKTWGDGDPITDAALNKMEAGIDGVNKKTANISSQINDIKSKIESGEVKGNLINQNGGGVLKIWAGTKVEYDALLVKDEDTVYLVEGSGGDSTVTYTITNNLTNCTNSNSASTIAANNSYTATITANTDYTLDTVTVSMGGNDVTSTVYSNGSIFIDSVIGDIIITASATQNTIGGGDEPVTGYDLSNANYSVTEYLNTTGTLTRGNGGLHPLTIIDYIEVPVGTTITMEDSSSSITNIYIAAYDSSKTFIERVKSNDRSTSYSYTFGNTTKYIRITIAALSPASAATMLENVIVKINGNLVTFPTVTIP